MHSAIQQKLGSLRLLCGKHNVRKLSLFGSATGEEFEPGRSDVDVLVEFQALSPTEHAERYFGLADDLEQLLGGKVDLVEPEALHNPYFRKSVEASQVVLYDTT